MAKTTPAVERFWSHVVKSEGCWFWNGEDTGYHATMTLTARKTPIITAHVFSYTLHNGPIPKGLVVRHKCDRPSCVRPDHLELGTFKDNSRDAVERNRMAFGERQGSAKLTEAAVVRIREEYASGARQPDLATKNNVCLATITKIVSGDYWRRAPGPTGSRTSTYVPVEQPIGVKTISRASARARAEDIRARWRTGQFSQADLARQTGLHQSAISRIVNGKRHQ